MNKLDYLDYLYYLIGKQRCDFELQIQNKDGFMSKRRMYSDVGFSKEKWFLGKANARTILTNEVVLDIDPEKDETAEQFHSRLVNTVRMVLSENADRVGIFESNRGVHIHLFYNAMFHKPLVWRKKFRSSMIKKYQADPQKSSERVTINLEFANHWKSGKVKGLLKGNLLEE